MNAHSSAAPLVQLLHQYYPTDLLCDDPAYKASAEARRLTQKLADEQSDTLAWASFVRQASEEFASCKLWDTTLLWIDPCYRLRISLPETEGENSRCDVIICLVSVLAPAYVLYASHSLGTGPSTKSWTRYPPLLPELQPYEARLATLIESSVRAARLPNDVLFTPIPDLAPRTGGVALGKARLIDLLFTPDRW